MPTHIDEFLDSLKINKFPSKNAFLQAVNDNLIGDDEISFIADDFVQADWEQTDPNAEDYIKHKPTSLQGNQGVQGVQGVQGRQGVQGVQGLKGDQGVQGVQGLKGDQGVQGIQGLKGDQGVQGVQGLKGDQGVQGRQGVQGVQGVQGLQGCFGFQGIQGIDGNNSILWCNFTTNQNDIVVCDKTPSQIYNMYANGGAVFGVYDGVVYNIASCADNGGGDYYVKFDAMVEVAETATHICLYNENGENAWFVEATPDMGPTISFNLINAGDITKSQFLVNNLSGFTLDDIIELFNSCGKLPIGVLMDANSQRVFELFLQCGGIGVENGHSAVDKIWFYAVADENGKQVVWTITGTRGTGSDDDVWTARRYVLDGNPIEVTYSELVNLRDNGLLIPNAKYQITDYVTMINEHSVNMLALSGLNGSTDLPIDYYKLAESTYGTQAYKQFDIIVTALDSGHLDENCRMTKHGNETYFDDFDLRRWKIKYCLDNDTSIFEFACSHNEITAVIGTGDTVSVSGTVYNTTPLLQQVAQNEHYYSGVITDGSTFGTITYMLIGDDTTTMYDENHNVIGQLTSSTLVSGRGVVYYMEDMNDNKLSYDYINIKFHRFGVDLSQSEDFSGSCIDYGTGSDGICAFDMLNLSQIMDGEQTITEDYYYTFHDRATGENAFDKFASITILDTTQICVELYGLYMDIFNNATLPHNVFLADISNGSMFSNAAKYLYGYTLKHTQGSTFIITDIGYDESGMTSRLLENVYGCVFGSVSGNYLKVPNMERCALIVAIELDAKHMSYVSQCQFIFVYTGEINYVNKCDFYNCSGFTIGDDISNCTFRNVHSSVFGSGLGSCFFTGTFLSIGNRCSYIGFFGYRYINGYDIESSYDKVSANCIKIGDFCNYIYFNNRNVGSNAQTIGYQNIVIGNCCSYMDFYSDDYNLYKNIIVADNFNGGKNSSTEECFHLSEFVEMWYPRSSADFYYNKNYNIKVGRNSFDEIVCWIDGDFVQPKYFVPDLTYVKNGNSVVVSAANSNYDIVYSNSFIPTPNNFNSSGNGSLTIYIPQADYMYFVAYDINTLICGKPLVLKISDL